MYIQYIHTRCAEQPEMYLISNSGNRIPGNYNGGVCDISCETRGISHWQGYKANRE